MTIKKVGILDENDELVLVSECNSQVGDEFDGFALWNTIEEAKEINDDVGGLADGYRFVELTITY